MVMSKVVENLYIGSLEDANDEIALKAAKIIRIISIGTNDV
jgi:hypothetical protein